MGCLFFTWAAKHGRQPNAQGSVQATPQSSVLPSLAQVQVQESRLLPEAPPSRAPALSWAQRQIWVLKGACKHEHAQVHKQASSSKAENTTEASGDSEAKQNSCSVAGPQLLSGQDGQGEALSTGPGQWLWRGWAR